MDIEMEITASPMQVAVFPSTFLEAREGTVPQGPVAALFAAVALVTTLNACGVPILEYVLGGEVDIFNQKDLAAALPGTLATIAILGKSMN